MVSIRVSHKEKSNTGRIYKSSKLEKLIILEEHTENGGLVQQLVLNLLEKHKVILKKVAHLFAKQRYMMLMDLKIF